MMDRDSLNAINVEAAKLLAAFGVGGLTNSKRCLAMLPKSLRIDPADVILITGPSGSGKSQTLTLLLAQLEGSVDIVPYVAPMEHTAIIDHFPDPDRALRLLSVVGLADALIWARRPDTLSVGQRARLEIALALNGPGHVIVIDEFLATLDRPTAKAVAWAAQRACRKEAKGLIAITAQDDVTHDLQPDHHIVCGWQDEPDVYTTTERGGPCSILREITVNEGDGDDWRRLKPLHYAAGNPATIRGIWTARHPEIQGPAGVVVASFPDLHSAARNLSTDDRYKRVHDRRVAQQLNREVAKISRIVIAPQVRGIGLAHVMLENVVPALAVRYVECVTSMGRWSGFLERCGFREVPSTSHPAEAALMDWAARTRPPAAAYLSGEALLDHIDLLSVRKRREARQLIWLHYHHFVLHRRTRKAPAKNVADPTDPRWLEAADLGARRLHERPSYWITGPMDHFTGMPENEEDQTVKVV